MSDLVGQSGVIFHCHIKSQQDCRAMELKQTGQYNQSKFDTIEMSVADPKIL